MRSTFWKFLFDLNDIDNPSNYRASHIILDYLPSFNDKIIVLENPGILKLNLYNIKFCLIFLIIPLNINLEVYRISNDVGHPVIVFNQIILQTLFKFYFLRCLGPWDRWRTKRYIAKGGAEVWGGEAEQTGG